MSLFKIGQSQAQMQRYKRRRLQAECCTVCLCEAVGSLQPLILHIHRRRSPKERRTDDHHSANTFGRHVEAVRWPSGHHPASASRPASVISNRTTSLGAHRHGAVPAPLSRAGCSRQFGRASAPMMPYRVHTMRGPNDGSPA
jgi:hypothetical protein